MQDPELGARIAGMREELRRRGLDAYIVSSGENIWYLTNLVYQPEQRPFFIVIPAKGKPTLIVPTLEARHLGTPPIESEVLAYWEFPSQAGSGWADVLRRTLKGAHVIGIEGKMKASIVREIQDLSPAVVDVVEDDQVGAVLDHPSAADGLVQADGVDGVAGGGGEPVPTPAP